MDGMLVILIVNLVMIWAFDTKLVFAACSSASQLQKKKKNVLPIVIQSKDVSMDLALPLKVLRMKIDLLFTRPVKWLERKPSSCGERSLCFQAAEP